MSIETYLFGIKLQSPFILGSGPLSYGAKGLIRAHNAGAGAVVTKTIRDNPAVNPFPHMAVSGKNSMINAEEWSDIPGSEWVAKEIPEAKKAGVVVIASIGHTPLEAKNWVGKVSKAGADIIELVSYERDTILPMLKKAKLLTKKPVLVKISPNWVDAVGIALEALEAGADGITAIDSIGPVLRIDIKTGKPLIGGGNGFGWLTGSSIKPITLRYVAEISSATDKPVIGLGGVTKAEDAVEMLMAGASAVGICTAPIVKGVEYISKLNVKLEKLITELGYNNSADLSGLSHKYLNSAANNKKFDFIYNPESCTECMACVKACAYEARTLSSKNMSLDTDLCRYCGLCFSVCPNGSLRPDYL
ncbi:MAG: 4Fe-4S binding protein [Spirochaetia bacterium]|jgi:dihydroorotate dehydrogenase subfamily 1|nr:4Fe-4S binding protein [Spirochaetia bacterium]